MLRYLGLGVSYGVYAIFGLVAYFFVKSYVKETKGRSLEDMSREQDEEERKHAEQAGQ
jgi:SP family sugar:H+ symporter-like MFS transporter